MKYPLVSIIITAHNKERYIGAAIESAINQSYHNLEVIVIDDASTDMTLSVCRKYGKEITLIPKSQNLGLYACRMEGIELAHGKYVTFLDADDRLGNDAIMKVVDKAEESGAHIVQMEYCHLVTSLGVSLMSRSQYNANKAVDACLYNERLFPVACWGKLYLKELLDRTEFMTYQGFWGEDRIFNLSIYGNKPVITVERRAKYYYRWGGETTNRYTWSRLEEYKEVYMAKKYWAETNGHSDKTELLRQELTALLAYHTRHAIDSGMFKDEELISMLQHELNDSFWHRFGIDASDLFHKSKKSLSRIVKRFIRNILE